MNEVIRNKIRERRDGQIALENFEKLFGKVEFYKISHGYYNMFAYGSKGYADDVFCVAPSIGNIISYMQGAVHAKNGEIEKQMRKAKGG